MGTTISGPGIAMDLLDACFGLKLWDRFFDPRLVDGLLVAPDREPEGVVHPHVTPKG